MRIATILALLGLLAPLSAAAQQAPPRLVPGIEVRVYTATEFAAGRLETITDTTIVILEHGRQLTFPLAAILGVQARIRGEWVDLRPTDIRPKSDDGEPSESVETPTAGPATRRLEPAAGDRVRVRVAGERVDGMLVAIRADSVVLERRGDAGAVAVPRGSIEQIEVYRGTRGHAGAGALVGLIVGAAGGAAAFAGLCSAGFSCGDPGGAAMAGGFLGGLAGAGLGALLGWAIRSDRWVAVPSDGLTLGAVVAPDRLALGARVAF